MLEEQIHKLGLPDVHEIEITTIGIGGASGESVIIHIGDNKWAIIDSCMSNKEVLPLLYLRSLGVDFTSVCAVICTHWHEDHIKGLNVILEACPQATFFIAKVGQMNNFLKYVITENFLNGSKGVWAEFCKCLNVLKKDKNRRKLYAQRDTHLLASSFSHLYSVSPADEMMDRFDQILKNANPAKLPSDKGLPPNMCCMAVVLHSNGTNIIIGADLESNNQPVNIDDITCTTQCFDRKEMGWCNVMEDSTLFNSCNYDYVKIPHHSSATGYCPRLWNNQTSKNVIGVSTMFVNNAGILLPPKKMLQQYLNNCSKYYITSSYPLKRRDPKGKSELDELYNSDIKAMIIMPEQVGIVCSRKRKNETEWDTHLLGAAIEVTQEYVNRYISKVS